MRTAILSSLVAGSCAVAAPRLKDPPPKPSPLVGEWEAVSMTVGGRTESREDDGIYVFTANGRWGFKRNPDDEVGWNKYRADDKADPMALDLMRDGEGEGEGEGEETTWQWLYQVDGDTLKVCWQGGDGTIRPAVFEAGKGSKNVIQTLKKITPKK
jgi:uncharacterized protein (TIGR03067 family)